MNKKTSHTSLIQKLLNSNEPSIRWKIEVNVLGKNRQLPAIKALETEIKNSKRVRALLQHVDDSGILRDQRGVYDKWQGSHWVLMTLADIGYPKHDNSLQELANEVLKTWLGKRYFNDYSVEKKADVYKRRDAIPVMKGRHRICASQQANALYILNLLKGCLAPP